MRPFQEEAPLRWIQRGLQVRPTSGHSSSPINLWSFKIKHSKTMITWFCNWIIIHSGVIIRKGPYSRIIMLLVEELHTNTYHLNRMTVSVEGLCSLIILRASRVWLRIPPIRLNLTRRRPWPPAIRKTGISNRTNLIKANHMCNKLECMVLPGHQLTFWGLRQLAAQSPMKKL